MIALAASNFVYFYQYNGLKAVWKKYQQGVPGQRSPPQLSTGMNLVIATIAGVINVFTTTPFWVVSTRLAVQRPGSHGSSSRGASPSGRSYSGMLDGLTTIYREEGIGALWNGTGPSLLLVSNPSIQFVVYERVRQWMAARASARGSPITTFEFFVVGAIAKAVATVVTYPIQLAQSRLRAMKAKSKGDTTTTTTTYEYSGTLDVLVKVLKQDGFWGLFRGCEAKLWQTVLTAAFMMVSYEKISSLVFRIMIRNAKAKAAAAAAAGAGGGVK